MVDRAQDERSRGLVSRDSGCALLLVLAAGLWPSLAAAADPGEPPSIPELRQLSIEDLANVDISSVTKTSQPLSDAAAAIYVITHEDVLRSGATSIPEMLRLAPNLQVARLTNSSYAITARGFNGTVAAKLLVLIDGRTVYTPFQGGVFWDVQNVLPEDIDRIEVISGPGATLWGANAVNGVINIITRRSSETQGAYLEGGAGNFERRGAAQYGGMLGSDASYRAYFTGYDYLHSQTAAGTNAGDGLYNFQGGFHLDWHPAGELLTLQGDAYTGSEHQSTGVPNLQVSGENLLTRWTHEMGVGTALQVQAYYDHTVRATHDLNADFIHTYDIDVQQSFPWGDLQSFVVGGGYRVEVDNFPTTRTPGAAVFFMPQRRTEQLANLFVQDTIAVTDAFKITPGAKLERERYGRTEPLPSLRLSWKVAPEHLLWGAVSRAVRAPTRLDRDLVETVGKATEIGRGDFQPEKLIAYELGYRAQPVTGASLSVSTYYNDYNDLRTAEFSPGGKLPIVFANQMEGDTYGVETWGSYQLLPWWRVSGGLNWMHKNLRFKPGSSRLGGIALAGDDPAYQFSLHSAMDVSEAVTFDFYLRNVSTLPNPANQSYTELDAHLGWVVANGVDVSLRATNLLHGNHLEFGSVSAPLQLGSSGVETGRAVFVDTHWRF